jgi:hypothetical protein
VQRRVQQLEVDCRGWRGRGRVTQTWHTECARLHEDFLFEAGIFRRPRISDGPGRVRLRCQPKCVSLKFECID